LTFVELLNQTFYRKCY